MTSFLQSLSVIDEGWAREALIPPYHTYLETAYQLRQEARAGLSEFEIPHAFENLLFGGLVRLADLASSPCLAYSTTSI